MPIFDPTPPTTTPALRSVLATLHTEITDYLDTFSTEAFFADQGAHWSPAGHMRHLAKSVRPVARAMAMPKLALRLRFGSSRTGSRTFEDIRAIYHDALAGGGQAGPYGPSSKTPDLEPGPWREQIMRHWAHSGDSLLAQLDRWRDRDLDRLRLPHPLLGKLTVREMLLFTLYHNAHHARRIAERAVAE